MHPSFQASSVAGEINLSLAIRGTEASNDPGSGAIRTVADGFHWNCWTFRGPEQRFYTGPHIAEIPTLLEGND
jgi:hypothetical protein